LSTCRKTIATALLSLPLEGLTLLIGGRRLHSAVRLYCLCKAFEGYFASSLYATLTAWSRLLRLQVLQLLRQPLLRQLLPLAIPSQDWPAQHSPELGLEAQ